LVTRGRQRDSRSTCIGRTTGDYPFAPQLPLLAEACAVRCRAATEDIVPAANEHGNCRRRPWRRGQFAGGPGERRPRRRKPLPTTDFAHMALATKVAFPSFGTVGYDVIERAGPVMARVSRRSGRRLLPRACRHVWPLAASSINGRGSPAWVQAPTLPGCACVHRTGLSFGTCEDDDVYEVEREASECYSAIMMWPGIAAALFSFP